MPSPACGLVPIRIFRGLIHIYQPASFCVSGTSLGYPPHTNTHKRPQNQPKHARASAHNYITSQDAERRGWLFYYYVVWPPLTRSLVRARALPAGSHDRVKTLTRKATSKIFWVPPGGHASIRSWLPRESRPRAAKSSRTTGTATLDGGRCMAWDSRLRAMVRSPARRCCSRASRSLLPSPLCVLAQHWMDLPPPMPVLVRPPGLIRLCGPRPESSSSQRQGRDIL